MRDQVLRIAFAGTRAVVHLKCWLPEPTLPSLIPAGLGGEIRVLNIGPGEWYVVSDRLDGPALHERLARYLKEDDIAAADLTCGLKALRVEGPAARELLTRGCGLDLHPEQFPAGRCTRTRFAQLPIIVHCPDARARFDLYVGRSYLAYLQSWLTDAAMEFEEGPQ
jgi:sarcosine oxidase, subunit gamma